MSSLLLTRLTFPPFPCKILQTRLQEDAMGEKLSCFDCAHHFDHPGCIHSEGTGNRNSCLHFDDASGLDALGALLFPECYPHRSEEEAFDA
jgi:hypothetical protein